MVGLPPKTPSITDVYSLAEYFLSLEEVESAAPVISTMAMLYPVDLADDYEVPEDATSSMPICYGFAVDTESYQKVFPQFTVEGNWPTKKEPSVLLDNRIKEGTNLRIKSSVTRCVHGNYFARSHCLWFLLSTRFCNSYEFFNFY